MSSKPEANFRFSTTLSGEERLEARCLALQEAVKQQIPQGTEGEEKGRGYIMSSPLWHSPL